MLLLKYFCSLALFDALSPTYVLPQVQFALSSSPVFSHTDTVTNSERFYSSTMSLFEDTDEQEEVNELLMRWNRYTFTSWCFKYLQESQTTLNRQIFPSYSSAR